MPFEPEVAANEVFSFGGESGQAVREIIAQPKPQKRLLPEFGVVVGSPERTGIQLTAQPVVASLLAVYPVSQVSPVVESLEIAFDTKLIFEQPVAVILKRSRAVEFGLSNGVGVLRPHNSWIEPGQGGVGLESIIVEAIKLAEVVEPVK